MHPYRTQAARPDYSDKPRHGRMLVVALTMAVAGLGACTPGEKQAAKTVLDVADYLCVAARIDLPDTNAIAKACQIDDALTPAIKQVVDDLRAKRLEQIASVRCTK